MPPFALGIANQLTKHPAGVRRDAAAVVFTFPRQESVHFNYFKSLTWMGRHVNWTTGGPDGLQLLRARAVFSRAKQGCAGWLPDARWPVWASPAPVRGILAVMSGMTTTFFNRTRFVPRGFKLLDLPFSYLIAQLR